MEDLEPLLLQCDMHANPPVSVSWLYNGALLEQSTGKVVVTNDGLWSRLTVDKVDKDLHTGTYRCVVVSALYGENSRTFNVLVNGQ